MSRSQPPRPQPPRARPPRPPHNPCARTVALENAAFLDELRRHGNVNDAARAIGRQPSSMRRRRQRLPAFDAEWRAALVVAAARLGAVLAGRPTGGWEGAPRSALRTRGGEVTIAPRRGGGLQQRAARPGGLTRACEGAFLLALSVTCNVGLAAGAAGVSKVAVYRRRRTDPGFAREWRLALQQGYAALEGRLLAAADPASHLHDAWAHNAPPQPPPMSVNQMLQLLYLHQKEARLLAEPAHVRRRRGETAEAHGVRLGAMHREARRRSQEAFRVAEAARAARGERSWLELHLPLPDLAQVDAGRGAGGAPHDGGVALFGGWRLEELEARRAGEDAGGAEPI